MGYAIAKGNVDILKLLLERGADVEKLFVSGEFGMTVGAKRKANDGVISFSLHAVCMW